MHGVQHWRKKERQHRPPSPNKKKSQSQISGRSLGIFQWARCVACVCVPLTLLASAWKRSRCSQSVLASFCFGFFSSRSLLLHAPPCVGGSARPIPAHSLAAALPRHYGYGAVLISVRGSVFNVACFGVHGSRLPYIYLLICGKSSQHICFFFS